MGETSRRTGSAFCVGGVQQVACTLTTRMSWLLRAADSAPGSMKVHHLGNLALAGLSPRRCSCRRTAPSSFLLTWRSAWPCRSTAHHDEHGLQRLRSAQAEGRRSRRPCWRDRRDRPRFAPPQPQGAGTHEVRQAALGAHANRREKDHVTTTTIEAAAVTIRTTKKELARFYIH